MENRRTTEDRECWVEIGKRMIELEEQESSIEYQNEKKNLFSQPFLKSNLEEFLKQLGISVEERWDVN